MTGDDLQIRREVEAELDWDTQVEASAWRASGVLQLIDIVSVNPNS